MGFDREYVTSKIKTKLMSQSNVVSTTATATTSGMMSAADKAKLDSIEFGANNYVLPAASATTFGGVKMSLNGTVLSINT